MRLLGGIAVWLALAVPAQAASGPAGIAYVHGAAIWGARSDGSGAHRLLVPPPDATRGGRLRR